IHLAHIKPDVTDMPRMPDVAHLKFILLAGVEHDRAILHQTIQFVDGNGGYAMPVDAVQPLAKFGIAGGVRHPIAAYQAEQGNNGPHQLTGAKSWMCVPMSKTVTSGKAAAMMLAPMAERYPPAQCTTMGFSPERCGARARSSGSGMWIVPSKIGRVS